MVRKRMIYKFIDDKGTFRVKNPHKYNLYFPLTNREGSLLSSISPNLAGDIKKDNDHFLTPPASIEDLRSNLLCRRDFFIQVASPGTLRLDKTAKKTIRLSYAYDDILEAGFLYHKIIKNTEYLKVEITNFIPYDRAAEVMWIKVINKTGKKIKIIPTSFIPLYGRGEKNLRDHRHVTSLLNRISLNTYGIFLKPTMVFDEKKHRKNKEIYFVLGYEGRTVAPLGQFPTLDCFSGEGDLIFPQAIKKKIRPVKNKLPEHDGKESCAAFRFREKTIGGNREANYFLIIGMAETTQEIKDTFCKLNNPEKIKRSLAETKKYWLKSLAQVKFKFSNHTFDNWLLWVKIQPTLRRLFGCSYLPHFDYGKGGRGWRDLWQDTLALLFTEEAKAKKQLCHSFKGIRIDGTNATVITREGNFIPDRNSIARVWMDHGIWPYLTLKLYINKTADLSLLLKKTTYFQDGRFKRTKEINPFSPQKGCHLRTKNGKIYKGSVLEHILVQNLTQFFNVGSHNIIRLENADWNDGLDMAPKKGESVAFSFMYAHNLGDICLLLKELRKKTKTIFVFKELTLLLDRLRRPLNYGEYKEKQNRLGLYLEKVRNLSGETTVLKIDQLIDDLKEKSKHLFGWLKTNEWLKCGFFNGYYDERGRRVEGCFKGRTRIILASQVFSIMSGGPDDKQIKKIWSSIKTHLKDERLGGFRLNTDFGTLYLDLGRAFGFSYGDKENGSFFNHLVVLLAYALYKRGFIKEGFEAINSPGKMAVSPRAQIYPLLPEYFNGEGKGLYLYLTGSASWYIYTLLEEVLGIKFVFGEIAIEPKLLSDNFLSSSIEVSFPAQGKRIKIRFVKSGGGKALKIRELFFGGEKIIPKDNRYRIKKEWLIKHAKKEIALTAYLS